MKSIDVTVGRRTHFLDVIVYDLPTHEKIGLEGNTLILDEDLDIAMSVFLILTGASAILTESSIATSASKEAGGLQNNMVLASDLVTPHIAIDIGGLDDDSMYLAESSFKLYDTTYVDGLEDNNMILTESAIDDVEISYSLHPSNTLYLASELALGDSTKYITADNRIVLDETVAISMEILRTLGDMDNDTLGTYDNMTLAELDYIEV